MNLLLNILYCGISFYLITLAACRPTASFQLSPDCIIHAIANHCESSSNYLPEDLAKFSMDCDSTCSNNSSKYLNISVHPNSNCTSLDYCFTNISKKYNIQIQFYNSTDLAKNSTLEILCYSNGNKTYIYILNCPASQNNYKYIIIICVVIFFLILLIVAIILVAIFITFMTTSQRKRRIESVERGVRQPTDTGMENANKRLVQSGDVLMNDNILSNVTCLQLEGAGLEFFNDDTNPANNTTRGQIQPLYPILSSDSHSAFIYPNPGCTTSPMVCDENFTFDTVSESPISKYDLSPPRSPAPVNHNSRMFTFDMPCTTIEPDRESLTPPTPINFLETDSPSRHKVSGNSSSSKDSSRSARHRERFSQRSKSETFSSFKHSLANPLANRRGINLIIDLSYEEESIDQIKMEKSLNQNKRLTLETLVKSLLTETDFSREYTDVPLNKSRQSIPGTGHKDRYPDILPNKSTRVILQTIDHDPVSTYINANFIHGYKYSSIKYIAAQGPLKNTLNDFWRMISENHCYIIVMITTYDETEQARCCRYWPPYKQSETYGNISVTLISQDKGVDYFKSMLKIIDTQSLEERFIQHYWYTSWPDHGVPPTPEPLLKMVRDVNSSTLPKHGPIVIHCSAGVGRTGCYIAVDICQQQIKNESSVDILGTLCNLRRDRGTMIQTYDQYLFVHHALSHYIYTEKLISQELREKYNSFIVSNVSPVCGLPPRFYYNSSMKYIDDIINVNDKDEENIMSRHHELPLTPTLNLSNLQCISFIEPESDRPTLDINKSGNNLTTSQENKKSLGFIINCEQNKLISENNLPKENTTQHDKFDLQPSYQKFTFEFPTLPNSTSFSYVPEYQSSSPPPFPSSEHIISKPYYKKKNIPSPLTLKQSTINQIGGIIEPKSCPFFPVNINLSNAPQCSKEKTNITENPPIHPSGSVMTSSRFTFPEPAANFNTFSRTGPSNPTCSESNIVRTCAAQLTDESNNTDFSSFTWPSSNVNRISVPPESPITPRTPTMVH